MSEERYTIVVVPVPGWGVPPIVRLRKFLKAALRSWGLRCVECVENKPTMPPAGQGASERE